MKSIWTTQEIIDDLRANEQLRAATRMEEMRDEIQRLGSKVEAQEAELTAWASLRLLIDTIKGELDDRIAEVRQAAREVDAHVLKLEQAGDKLYEALDDNIIQLPLDVRRWMIEWKQVRS